MCRSSEDRFSRSSFSEFEVCEQGLALLSLVPIWLYRGRQGHHSKAFQYACYAFYPVHMLILGLIQLSL